MFKSSLDTLEQFKHILLELPKDCYAQSCSVLSNSSIGQHTRHIIELYLCLINGYETADVSYDRRERNLKLAEELPFAIEQLGWNAPTSPSRSIMNWEVRMSVWNPITTGK
jgi:hypothetical protein